MNTNVENIAKIRRKFQDTLIFAVTSHNKCVAIRVFPETNLLNSNGGVLPMLPKNYIDQCVTRAIELKLAIEHGSCDLKANEQIILNPSIDCTDLDFLIQSHKEEKKKNRMIKHENDLIQLARTMIHSARMENFKYDVCVICLSQMCDLSRNILTPLMLKKNPQIVRAVLKLCRFTDITQANQTLSNQCQQIRWWANQTVDAFKEVMNFKGSSENFLIWFNESTKNFCELTSNLSEDQRRNLTSDPEIILTKYIT